MNTYDVKVLKPFDLEYFRNEKNKGNFEKELDAIVYVFYVKDVGYVCAVTSSILKNRCESFFAGSSMNAVIVAAHSLSQFACNRDGGAFKLPWQTVLKYKNTSADITLEQGDQNVFIQAQNERNRDIEQNGGRESGVFPLDHYLWWNDYHKYYFVTKITLQQHVEEKQDKFPLPGEYVSLFEEILKMNGHPA